MKNWEADRPREPAANFEFSALGEAKKFHHDEIIKYREIITKAGIDRIE